MILESFFSLLCESRLDDVKVRYPDLTIEIDYLAKNDPSGNQKYLFWAAKMADQGENEREVAYLLADFHEQLSKIQQKDINTYKSLAELETIIDQAEETVSKTQKKQQKKEKGIKKIYEDDRWLVVEPITWEASCIYGRGTKWCISAKDQPQHWPTYKQFGVAFAFIFDKTKEQTDSLYKISVSFYPKEIIEQTREQWEASDDEEKEERLVGLRLQFGGDITYEQMESILYTGAEVYGAENNRLLTQDVQSMLGMDIWNQIQNSVVATERDMPSRQEVEGALQGQGFDLPEALLRKVVSVLIESVEDTKFYHGTYLEDARKIQKEGFVLARRRSRGASMGPAVYMSAKKEWAQGYVDDIKSEDKEAGLLILKLKPGIKFLDISILEEWSPEVVKRYSRDHGLPTNPINWQTVGMIARNLKYDAVGNPKGTVAVFDPENVLVVGLKETITENYGFKYREPGPNDIETTLWQNVDVDRIVRELAMRITNAVKGSRNEREARKRIRGILEKVPGIDSAEVSQAVLRMLGVE